LKSEAKNFSLIAREWKNMYLNKDLSPSDFAGSYILYYLGTRRKNKWAGGNLKKSIIEHRKENEAVSKRVCDIPGLLQVLDPDYLFRKLSIDITEISVITVFNRLTLTGLKANNDNYVNVSIVLWALNQYPFRLLFHIPSPMAVLRMQCQGERVVTVLVEEEELGREHVAPLSYMQDMPLHGRDAFEFLLHDLKHMSHFICPETHLEQVGFFRCMLGLGRGNPRAFFCAPLPCECAMRDRDRGEEFSWSHEGVNEGCVCDLQGCDTQLWLELEYVISDMNCYSTHLVRYLLAKMLLEACRRSAQTNEQDIENDYPDRKEDVLESSHTHVKESAPVRDNYVSERERREVTKAGKVETYRRKLGCRERRGLERRWALLQTSFGVIPCDEISDAISGAANRCNDIAIVTAFQKLLRTALGEEEAMDETQAEALRLFFRNKGSKKVDIL